MSSTEETVLLYLIAPMFDTFLWFLPFGQHLQLFVGSPETLTSGGAEPTVSSDWWPQNGEQRWTDSFYQDWGLTRLKCSCTTPPPPFFASPLASSATPLYASESPHLTAATFSLIFSADPSSHLPTRGDMVRTWPTVRDFNQSLQNWHEVFCYLLLQERVRDNSQWSGPNTICTKRVG